ncbi:hypothetical protein ACFSQT_14180 [Mesorhizobium calcicola]|uniref:Uncharacterized protein n=1 Tax=Mesorhizobium calcicola TaxID=1300310 RepID=A0ABW4WC17_9HYPH
MVTWHDIEQAVEKARMHFASAGLIRGRMGAHPAGSLDDYTTEMALRHAIQSGETELSDAASMLQHMLPAAADSMLSEGVRCARVAIHALAHDETLSPSSIGPGTLAAAADAAAVMAEALVGDFARIRKEVDDV